MATLQLNKYIVKVTKNLLCSACLGRAAIFGPKFLSFCAYHIENFLKFSKHPQL